MRIYNNAITDKDLKTIYELSRKEELTSNKPYTSLHEWGKSEEERNPSMKIINKILNKVIIGFHNFDCFVDDKFGEPGEKRIRFHYNYGHDSGTPFSGVGYLYIDELKGGFRK